MGLNWSTDANPLPLLLAHRFSLVAQIVTEMVKAVFQLSQPPLPCPDPGLCGTLGGFKVKEYGIECEEYINHVGLPAHFPSSLVVRVRIRVLCICALTDVMFVFFV